MTYNDDQLLGLKECPLVNGAFCIDTYRRWKTVNKLWPWDMTYEQWKQWIEETSTPLSDNPYVRAEQQLIRLSNFKQWFYAIKRRIENGDEIEESIYMDYLSRTNQ